MNSSHEESVIADDNLVPQQPAEILADSHPDKPLRLEETPEFQRVLLLISQEQRARSVEELFLGKHYTIVRRITLPKGQTFRAATGSRARHGYILSNTETDEVIFVSSRTAHTAYDVYKALDSPPRAQPARLGFQRIPRRTIKGTLWATSSVRPLLDKVEGHVGYPFDPPILASGVIPAAYYDPFTYNEDYTKRVQKRYAKKTRKSLRLRHVGKPCTPGSS